MSCDLQSWTLTVERKHLTLWMYGDEDLFCFPITMSIFLWGIPLQFPLIRETDCLLFSVSLNKFWKSQLMTITALWRSAFHSFRVSMLSTKSASLFNASMSLHIAQLLNQQLQFHWVPFLGLGLGLQLQLHYNEIKIHFQFLPWVPFLGLTCLHFL